MSSRFSLTDTEPHDCHTLSLHDALPIWGIGRTHLRRILLEKLHPRLLIHSLPVMHHHSPIPLHCSRNGSFQVDRKSTRLNSSHLVISYAVFCLKKTKYIVNKT